MCNNPLYHIFNCKYSHTSNNNHNYNRNKPKVILIDCCDEMKCKKEFTSYLNKLTDINKEIIYGKITNFIKELKEDVLNSLFDVIINFIKMMHIHFHKYFHQRPDY